MYCMYSIYMYIFMYKHLRLLLAGWIYKELLPPGGVPWTTLFFCSSILEYSISMHFYQLWVKGFKPRHETVLSERIILQPCWKDCNQHLMKAFQFKLTRCQPNSFTKKQAPVINVAKNDMHVCLGGLGLIETYMIHQVNFLWICQLISCLFSCYFFFLWKTCF